MISPQSRPVSSVPKDEPTPARSRTMRELEIYWADKHKLNPTPASRKSLRAYRLHRLRHPTRACDFVTALCDAAQDTSARAVSWVTDALNTDWFDILSPVSPTAEGATELLGPDVQECRRMLCMQAATEQHNFDINSMGCLFAKDKPNQIPWA